MDINFGNQNICRYHVQRVIYGMCGTEVGHVERECTHFFEPEAVEFID